MISSRVFLVVAGIVYVALAVWCAVLPADTSRAVGFSLEPGAGQSEFLAVYGGLQVGLGAFFLFAAHRPASDVRLALVCCAVLHGGIVAARTVSFALFDGIGATTFILAAVEWALFLTPWALVRASREPSGRGSNP